MTPFIRRMCFIVEPHTGNEVCKLKVLHENGHHGRADDFQYVAHHLAYYITETAYSMIRIVCIPHIGTKRKLLTKAGSPNILVLVHMAATYDNFQDLLGFLCRHVLVSLLDVHTRIDAFAAYKYKGMV